MKGLESDEVEFLDFCSQKQQEIDKQREMEEAHVLQQYRVSLLTLIAIMSLGTGVLIVSVQCSLSKF